MAAAGLLPLRRRVFHPGVERRAPAALVVPRELKVEALVRHADSDPPDASQGLEPCAERPERESSDGLVSPAKPSAALRSWPHWSLKLLMS